MVTTKQVLHATIAVQNVCASSLGNVVTILVSLVTRPRAPEELRGLVYGLTPKPVDTTTPWYERPVALAAVVLAVTLVLNVVFF